MKKSSAVILRILIVLLTVVVFTFLLVEPNFEGVNVGKTLFEIYFKDPLLAYAYMASIPFFVILFQAFKLLGAAGRNELVSVRESSVKVLRTIKYCAVISIGFVIGGVAWLLSMDVTDDRPPILMMGTVAVLVFAAIAVGAGKFERNQR